MRMTVVKRDLTSRSMESLSVGTHFMKVMVSVVIAGELVLVQKGLQQ